MNSKNSLETWRLADAEARAAESRLLAEWELYEKRLVAPPGDELLQQVTHLRSRANEALWIAMIALTGSTMKDHFSPSPRNIPL